MKTHEKANETGLPRGNDHAEPWSERPGDRTDDNVARWLQHRLGQSQRRRDRFHAAWPADWDVHFKLHAPKNTTVECDLRAGKIVKLEILPASRRKDVEIVGPR